MRFRRRNIAWLSVIGALVGVVVLSGVATPTVTVALVGLFLAALAASLVEFRPAGLAEAQRSSLARLRMTPAGQEATQRAQRRGGVPPGDLTLLDVGFIVSDVTDEGMVMRRTRAFSKDAAAVRPYVVLHVQPHMADVKAVVRFEMLDQNGVQQYVHEIETRLRDGEMNLLPDHQLRLAGNERLSGSGEGDLRVYVDGDLVGALSFTLGPSLRERDRQLARERSRLEGDDGETDEVADDAPMTLEDLMRRSQQNRRP
jgi:hypothetical protein